MNTENYEGRHDSPNGSFFYFKNGLLHREDGPAIYNANLNKYFFYLNNYLFYSKQAFFNSLKDEQKQKIIYNPEFVAW